MRAGRRAVFVAYTTAASDPRVRRHCESLARAGYRVIQIGLGEPSEPRLGRLGDVVVVRWRHARYRGGRLWRYAAAYLGFLLFARAVVRRLVRRRAVDVVQVTNLPDSLVLAARSARRRGAGVILDIRDPMPELFASKFGRGLLTRLAVWLLEAQERWASRRCDVVLTVNEAHRQATIAHGVSADRIRVALNAADENLVPLLAPREPREPQLVYHGTVAARMGLETVVDAVALLHAQRVPVCFDVYGDGDSVVALRRRVEGLGLAHAVSIPGRRHPMAELVPLIRRAAIAVVPMVRDVFMDLVLPSKLIEYVRLGLPVIVTPTPTVAAYFDETMVWYVDTAAPVDLANALQTVLAHPREARARAERAQQALAARPWQHFEGSYLGVVDAAATAGGRRAALFERRLHASAILGSARRPSLSRGRVHRDLPSDPA